MIVNRQSKRSKKTIKKTNNFRNFFSANLLNLLGILFLAIGLFYLVDSYFGYLYNLVYNAILINGSEEVVSNDVISQDYFYELVLYFSPAILGLVSCIVFFEKIKDVVVLIATLLIFYLVYFHFKITYDCYSTNLSLYSNFFQAGILLFFNTTLLCIIYLRSKNTLLFFFILFQFYISLIILKMQFLNFYLIPTSFVFTLGFYWAAIRVKSLSALFINLIFAVLFFVFFSYKKLILGSFPEYLYFFILFSLLFYILFWIVSFSKSFQDNKVAFLIFSMTSSLFYFIINAFVISKYYVAFYIIYPILVLLVFQVLSLYFIKKKELSLWIFPLEMHIAVLVAGLFIVLFNHEGTTLILAVVSIVLIKHALIDKNIRFVRLSYVTLMMMTFYFIYSFIPVFNAMLSLKMDLLESLFIDNLWNVIVTGISLYFLKTYVMRLNSIVSKKEINVQRYLVFLSGFLLVTVFILFEEISFLLVHLLTHTFLYSSLLVFILGCIFFMILIKNIAIVDVKLIKLLFGLMLLFMCLFPITEYYDVPISKFSYLLSTNFSIIRIVIHYIGLVLLFLLATAVIKKAYALHSKNSWPHYGIELFSSLILIFIVCKEYDFISILFNLANSNSFSIVDMNLVLDSNQLFPYSILTLIALFLIFFYGVVNKNRFLKTVSLLGIGILLARTFIFEDEELYQDFRVLIFIVLGIMLLLFSWSEKTFRKERKTNIISNHKRV